MKLIQKKRVLKAPVTDGDHAVLVVPADQLKADLTAYGLDALENVGDVIIPNAIKSYSKENIIGKIDIHKDREKELYSYEVPWLRKQFVGRNETELVCSIVTRTIPRYPRTYHKPEELSITLATNSQGEKLFVSSPIEVKNESRFKLATNLFLEIFGMVYTTNYPHTDLQIPLNVGRQLNWRILPKGNSKFTHQLKTGLAQVLKMKKKVYQDYLLRQVEHITKYSPSEIAIGIGGLQGYVAFIFKAYGFTVLESIHPNNATYVLGENWEALSKKTKLELIESKRAERLIHNKHWLSHLDNMMSRRRAA